MSYNASYCKHTLIFNFDAGTSRGILKEKLSYYLKLSSKNNPNEIAYGEISPLYGLSPEYGEPINFAIKNLCIDLNEGLELSKIFEKYKEFPSLIFGLETALKDLENNGEKIIFKNDFSARKSLIPINGLIWMNDKDTMLNEIKSKISEGFQTIKLKIGAIDFEQELSLLKYIRNNYSEKEITLRLDANGAFKVNEALEKLKILSEFKIHSIEQPIAQKNYDKMAEICEKSPIPIALDEELIGIKNKKDLLNNLKPSYIILKPSLLGGFSASEEWINEAEKMKIGWWITSALESNIGLNAICQFTAQYQINGFPQGLGTGKIYKNNIESPLEISNGHIGLSPNKDWALFNC